jgi:hypothetical protein
MSATKRHALRRTAWRCIRRATTTRSKVGVEIVNGALKGGGVGPACADQLCYTAATDSNEGKLSRDEEAVRENESKYGEYADHLEHTSIATRHGLLSGGRRGHRSFDDRYSNIIRCIAVD